MQTAWLLGILDWLLGKIAWILLKSQKIPIDFPFSAGSFNGEHRNNF